MHLPQFCDYLELEKNYSVHTVAAYSRDVETFLGFIDDMEVAIGELHYDHVRTWMSELVESGLKARTVNRKISSLSLYFDFLRQLGILQNDPLALHTSLKTDKAIQLPFSKKEILQLLNSQSFPADFNGLRDRLVIELLYATGVRRDELINLKLSAVDFNENTIRVLGKRSKERIIPLMSSLKSLVSQYIEERNALQYPLSGELLLTQRGKKLYPSLVYRVVKSYFSRVSSKVKISPHIIRHTFATHMLDEGADLNTVKELLGHSSLASTQVYTHMSMTALKDAHKKAHPRSSK
ncbi:MAG: tyrosine-type recombinase/integrase [Nonlabens sp.]